jgi:hypothetical protein
VGHCSAGYQYDNSQDRCIVNNAGNSDPNDDNGCPAGYYYDESYDDCLQSLGQVTLPVEGPTYGPFLPGQDPNNPVAPGVNQDHGYQGRDGAGNIVDADGNRVTTVTPTPPKSEMKIQGGIEDYCKNRERDESGLLTYDGGVCGGEENGYTAFIDTANEIIK